MEASSLIDDVKSPIESTSSISQPNDNQTTASAAAAAKFLDDSSTHQGTTISKGEDEKPQSISTTNDQHVRSDNHNDPSIKLKRCKHGRIIIKDLSKKKLAQHSDNGANTVTDKHSNESNNNHIVSGTIHTNDNGAKHELILQSNAQRLDPPETKELGNEIDQISPNIKSPKGSGSLKPRTPPAEPSEQNPDIKSSNQISPSDDTNRRDTKNRLILHARARSRSSSGSLSPNRVKSVISPKRSRRSRTPDRKNRSSSRDRIVGRNTHRPSDSPSPKRKARSSSSRRRKKRDERRRSPGRRRHRTPERHRHRSRRDSPAGRSPNRKLPRSRSVTPSRSRGTTHRRNQRDYSRSTSRDPFKYDRHSHINHERSRERFDKASHLQSPENRRLRTDAIDSAALGSYISTNLNNHDNQSSNRQNVAQSGTKSPIAQALSTGHQPPSQKFLPEQAQVAETSPSRSPVAQSPATPPLDDGSSSSDIYDPEAPIIPISPCDSPPISPMTNTETNKPKLRSNTNERAGEDDVPSSAVQLNQQEKYLQKLNRQERVIEEVKVALRPFYQNRSISKEQYKDVLRRAVPKICHSKNGEINPIKISALVNAYVKKMKH